jgi:hypothetical protein
LEILIVDICRNESDTSGLESESARVIVIASVTSTASYNLPRTKEKRYIGVA